MKPTASPTNRISDIIKPAPATARRTYIDRATMQRIARTTAMPALDVAATAPQYKGPVKVRSSWFSRAVAATRERVRSEWGMLRGYFAGRQRHYTAPRVLWVPKRYTREQGVHTNWQALKPTRAVTTGTSSLLILLLIAASFSTFSPSGPSTVAPITPTSQTGRRIGGGQPAWPVAVAMANKRTGSDTAVQAYTMPAVSTPTVAQTDTVAPSDIATAGGMGSGGTTASAAAVPAEPTAASATSPSTEQPTDAAPTVSTPAVEVQVGQVATVQVPDTSLTLPL